MTKQEMLQRFIDFSADVMLLLKSVHRSESGKNLIKQLNRSATSVSLNYSEALSAESERDFVHKLRVVLKELRETHAGLKLIKKLNLVRLNQELDTCIKECDELIAMMVASINTMTKKLEARAIQSAKSK